MYVVYSLADHLLAGLAVQSILMCQSMLLGSQGPFNALISHQKEAAWTTCARFCLKIMACFINFDIIPLYAQVRDLNCSILNGCHHVILEKDNHSFNFINNFQT